MAKTGAEQKLKNAHLESYDIIVIGSGIGGLTAAGLLAKAGKSVLLLEAHDRPGGYAHGFKRKRYHFDSGVHLISGCGSMGYRGGQVIYKVLKALKIENEIEFISIDPFSHADYLGSLFKLPQTMEAFIKTLGQKFPAQKQGLQALTQLCLQVAEEITIADELMANVDYEQAQKLMPSLFKYRKATLASVAEHFISDPELLGVFASNWPYLGLPPAKVSFVYWSTMLMGYIVDGAYYCQGGFQILANTLVKGIEKHGGVVQFKSAVEQISLQDRQVTGVVVNGQQIAAPIVVSNADIRQTVYQLVGEQYFSKRYLQRLRKMQHSLSIFVVYIATDLDLKSLNIAHETFCYSDYDHDRNYQQTQQGKITWLSITAPTLIDPTLAPAGEHLLMLTTLLPYQTTEYWRQAKQKQIDVMLKIAAKNIPDLENHILYIEGGSPSTMERYTQNYQGAAYGWDVIPEQIGPSRIQNQSPVKGLFYAGHWSSPGGGVYGVSVSGVQAVQQILGINKQSDII